MDIKAIEDYLNIESQRYPHPTLDALTITWNVLC